MADEPLPSGPDVDRLIVPQELMKKLGEARERFRLTKEKLGTAMDASEYDHEKDVDNKFGELREAEKNLEDLTAKVQEILGRKVS